MFVKICLLFCFIIITILFSVIFKLIDRYIDLLYDNEKIDYFTLEKIQLNKGDEKIFGTLCLPKLDVESFPVFILAHGFGVNHKSMIKYSRMLAKKGFASVTFDFVGGSSAAYSDGDMEDMSVITEFDDLKIVVDYIKNIDYLKNDEIYLLGHSQGAVVCALYANKYPEDITRLFLINPAFVLADATREADLPKKGESYVKYDEKKGRRYFLDGRKIKLYDSFTNYEDEVLIFQGDGDIIAPLEYAKKARRAYKNAYLYVMEGERHMISEAGIKKIIDIIAENIKESSE